MDIWKQIQNYRDLQDVNILFLQGGLNETPYHLGPVDPETIPLLEDLIAINDLGFVSVMGQPALDETLFVNKTWQRNGRTYGNWWLQSQQRSFIEGYLPKAYLDTFLDFMTTQPDYFYRVYDIRRNTGWFGGYSIQLPVLHNSMPSELNITRERTSRDQSTIYQMDWDYPTNIFSDMSPPFDFSKIKYPNIEKVMIPYTVKIIISSKEYNSGSVERLLLDFFHYLHQIISG